MKLRDYQQKAHDDTVIYCKKSNEPAIHNMSVGAGKSLSIAFLVDHVSKLGGKCLVLSRQAEIIEQNSEEAWGIGCKNSIYSASLNKKSTYYPVIFGTEGTVQRSLETEFKDITMSLVIVDEAHMVDPMDCLQDMPESQYGKIIKHFKSLNPKLRVIGYTGSPYRGSESILGEFWKEQLSNVSTFQLIGKGFLVPPVFGFGDDENSYDLSAFKKTSETEDYSAKELQAMGRSITKEKNKTQLIMEEVLVRTKDRLGVMITCASKKHCEQVAECLPENSWGIITDSTGSRDRRNILTNIKNGKLRYIIQVGCLTTGFNAPILDTSVILRKIGSLTLIIQLLGRVLRILKPEQVEQGLLKSDALVLDYAGTFESIGDIFDDPIISQATSAKAKFINQTKECPKCATLNSEHAVRCSGIDETSIDDRCDYFFSFTECKNCGAHNAPTAKSCRICEAVLIDPNKALRNKAYSDADYKPVKRMILSKTKTDKLCVSYQLDAMYSKNGEQFPEVAKEYFSITNGQKYEYARWTKFINQHICGDSFRRTFANFKNIEQIITMKAMLDIPTEITHRVNDKGFSIINGKRFRSGRSSE